MTRLAKIIAFILWTLAMLFGGALFGVKTQPPTPIKYRVETQAGPPTWDTCKKHLEKYLRMKGA